MLSFIKDNNHLHNPNVFAVILTTQIGVDTFAPLRTFRMSVLHAKHMAVRIPMVETDDSYFDTDDRNQRFIF